jgi:hypothetical protein
VLLLSCGVAMEDPELKESTRTRLQKIEGFAKHVSEKLAMSHQEHAAAASA